MPVISENALARVFASYSWVVMVSETTLISMPAKGFAAFTNHSISFNCSSFESVEGWNSLSTHRRASSMPASAAVVPNAMATALADTRSRRRVLGSIAFPPKVDRFPPPTGSISSAFRPQSIDWPSHVAEHRRRVDKAKGERPPQVGTHDPEPGERDEGGTEQRYEKAVAAGRRDAQDPDALLLRPPDGQEGHHDEQAGDRSEEQTGLPRPSHPAEIHDGSLKPAPRQSPWRCSSARTRS